MLKKASLTQNTIQRGITQYYQKNRPYMRRMSASTLRNSMYSVKKIEPRDKKYQNFINNPTQSKSFSVKKTESKITNVCLTPNNINQKLSKSKMSRLKKIADSKQRVYNYLAFSKNNKEEAKTQVQDSTIRGLLQKLNTSSVESEQILSQDIKKEEIFNHRLEDSLSIQNENILIQPLKAIFLCTYCHEYFSNREIKGHNSVCKPILTEQQYKKKWKKIIQLLQVFDAHQKSPALRIIRNCMQQMSQFAQKKSKNKLYIWFQKNISNQNDNQAEKQKMQEIKWVLHNMSSNLFNPQHLISTIDQLWLRITNYSH